MPLHDHEQRMLDQIRRSLRRRSKFASSVGWRGFRADRAAAPAGRGVVHHRSGDVGFGVAFKGP